MEKADSGRATLTLCSVFLLTTAGILLAGLYYYRAQKRELEAKANAELAAVAHLKARRISDWRRGLPAHEKLEFGNPTAAASLTDLELDDVTENTYIPLGVPIASASRDKGRAPGIVLLRVDPRHWLYPYPASWSSPGRKAETAVMRRSDGYVVALSDLRDRPHSAMRLRAPVTMVDRPSVRSFSYGERDAVRGRDSLGDPVVASFRPVEGSGWMLMSKMDESDIYGPVEARTILILCVLGVLIGFAALSVGLLWRVMTARFQQRQLEAELRQKALEGHYSLMARHARDVILLCDETGRIIEANDRAAETYGYTRAELLSLKAIDLRAPGTRDTFESDWRHLRLDTGLLFETVHCRKNGTEFPVEISRWPIEVDGRVFRQAIIRDISQRKRHENELHRVNRALRVLSEFNHLLVQSPFEHELLEGLCRVLVDSGGYSLAWISLAERMYDGVPVPETVAGADHAVFRKFTSTWVAGRLQSCPMSLAIRTGEPVIIEDLTSVPRSEIWRGAALAQGFISALGLPIWVDGSVYAGLTIFSRELHSFFGEELSLLQELARDLAFGIEALRGRKRRDDAEAALHLAEGRARRIFESLPAGMITCRVNSLGRLAVTSANPASGRLLGLGDSVEAGKLLSGTAPIFAGETLAAELARLSSEGGEFQTIRRETNGGQSVRSFDVFCFQVAPGEAAIMFNDISERRAGEEALRRAHRLLDAVVESSPAAIVVLDSSRRIRLWNHAAEVILGWTATEALGRLFPIAPANDPALARRITHRLMNRQSVVGIEVRPARKDGTAIDLSLSAGVLESGPGVQPGVVLVFEDISQRKHAEKLLRRSEQRLELVIEATGAGVWDWDIEAGRSFVNDQGLRMLGYDPSPGGVPQQFWIGNMHPDDVEVVDEMTRRAFRSPEGVYEAEFRIRRKNGGYIWILSKGRVVERSREGRALRMIGTNTDITARKAIEAQLNQALRIESIGRLAGGIAHDFNNLLTIINGFSELLLRNARQDDPATHHLREIHDAGQRAAMLTSQLLAVSRKQRLQPQVINLNDQIRELTQMLGRLLGPGIHLVTELAPDLPSVLADPSQISQVLMNLAVNARDAMPSGGSVKISTKSELLHRMTLPQQEEPIPGLYARIDVRDTGTGMSEDTLQHIFEPFFTTKEPDQGTGLGLATVYGIIRQSGGSIRVASTLGQGSVFTILLPAAERCEDGVRPAHVQASQGCEVPPLSGLILLVEDEAEVRRFARETLSSAGYTILEASCGDEALRVLDGHAIVDLLLTDVVMPGMSGETLAERVRDARPGVRIVFMSGFPGDGRLPNELPMKGDGYLQKPFTSAELLGLVRGALALPAGGN